MRSFVRFAVSGTLAGLAVLLPGMAAAQVYDVPSFNTPYGENGWGLYLVFQNDVDDAGAVVGFRRSGASFDYGLRGGLVDVGDEVGIFGGVDLKDQFVTADEQFPLDVAWVTGAGLGFVLDRDIGILRVPGGVSLGRTLEGEGGEVSFTPYVYPRLALDVLLGDGPGDPPPGADDDDADLNFDVDIGMDIGFGEDWKFRFGATLGDNEAIGFGLAF